MIMCNTIFWVRICWRPFGIQRGHTVLGICCQCSNMEFLQNNCDQDPARPLLVLGYKFSERVTSREARLQWVSIHAAALGTPVAKTVSLQAPCRCWEAQKIGHVLFRCIPFLLLLPFLLQLLKGQSHLLRCECTEDFSQVMLLANMGQVGRWELQKAGSKGCSKNAHFVPNLWPPAALWPWIL